MTPRAIRQLLITALLVAPSVASAWPVYGDYDSEIREANARADGIHHVDTPALIARLRELHATTYAFLIYHQPSDYADLANEFLPAADAAGIEIWAYIVPPSERPANYPPCNADYVCWGRTLGTLAASHPSLTAIVIDDFSVTANLTTFTPAYTASVRRAARAAAPAIQLFPIGYFTGGMTTFLAQNYVGAIDGVVFPYADLDTTAGLVDQLQQFCQVMHNPTTELHIGVPANTLSNAGDLTALYNTMTVGSGSHTFTFGYRDDYPGATSGHHFFQMVVNSQVVFERDVAGPGLFAQYTVNLDAAVAGRTNVPVSFRIIDRIGVGNFAVDVDVYGFSATGLTIDATPWMVRRVNAATWSAYAANRDYRGRCVLMVYAAGTAMHAPPTLSYITTALSLGHDEIVAGRADGEITYLLDKTPSSTTFPPVASLFDSWTTRPGDAGVQPDVQVTPPDDGVQPDVQVAPMDVASVTDDGVALTDASASPDAVFAVDGALRADVAMLRDAHAEGGDVAMADATTSHGPPAGACGCHVVPHSGGRHALAWLGALAAVAWRRRNRARIATCTRLGSN